MRARLRERVNLKTSALIHLRIDQIAREFERFVAQRPEAKGVHSEHLRDAVPELLNAIVRSMDAAEQGQQEYPDSDADADVAAYTKRHAATRLEQGFSLEHLVLEYCVLRRIVLGMQSDTGAVAPLAETIRFNSLLDKALTESVAWYAAQLERARQLFLAVLGHDLRNPLGAAMVCADVILKDKRLSAHSTVAAVRLMNSTSRMNRLVEDLIDFTRTRLGTRLPTSTSFVELNSVIGQVLDELRAYHPTSVLRYQSTEAVAGMFDGARIAQMVSNLVGNAIQHGDPERPVTVRLETEGQTALVRIHNNGPAIPPQLKENIFDPLTRGLPRETQENNHRPSLGLGLHISREIVRAHEGSITVDSSAETGTTFTIRLPIVPPSPPRAGT